MISGYGCDDWERRSVNNGNEFAGIWWRLREALNNSEKVVGGRARVAHGHVVRLAEDYAMAHGSERLYITDLCRITGVSERTLEVAFKEVIGLAPMAYLARLRLHRVRQALLAATNGPTTVAAAAVEWGFWHFGEFSRAYKEYFGELPSETLRRRDY